MVTSTRGMDIITSWRCVQGERQQAIVLKDNPAEGGVVL